MKTLIVLESPGKVKKVQGFLGNNFIVKASVGHIRDLEKSNSAIDKKNGFEPTYVISEDKKDVVKELKEIYKKCDDIILLTDMDKEGEAIAFHVCAVLGIDPLKTKRGVTVEITEKGIKKAVEKPGFVNMDKVYAQQARRILDRLVGFDLSPLLWNKIQKGLSAGRVQSVATRIIVDRENEINKFASDSDFKIIAIFEVKDKQNKTHAFKALLNKRYKNKNDAVSFLQKCINAEYKVKNIETKPGKRSASAPFTTSTIQQEAGRKFGYAVDKTMQICQKLYEAGHITYMRTDSVTLSEEALNAAESEIKKMYGNKYSNKKQYQTKTVNAAEAHECLRPTHFENKTINGTDDEIRIYELIWKRTIASQMTDALFDRTTVIISTTNHPEDFVAKGEVLKFDGFLKLYKEDVDNETENEDEENASLPEMEKGQLLSVLEIQGNETFNKPAPRYTQASLVKKMEELGVGRPSTFASTIKTIVDRGYVETKNLPARKREITYLKLIDNKIDESIKSENFGAEKSKLFPTDIGKVVTDYLVKSFPIILDYKFTAEIETKLDAIEQGSKKWNVMLKEFYDPFTETLKQAKGSTEKIGGRELGVNKDGKKVIARIARFGPVIQLGEDKDDIKFAKIPEGKSIDTITLNEALELLKWPRIIGEYKKTPITASIGKFGAYVKHADKFYSIALDPTTITLDEAIEIIKIKESGSGSSGSKTIHKFGDLLVIDGKYGAYISYKKKNYKIPAGTEVETLTEKECLEIVGESKSAPKKKFTKFTKKAKK